MDRVLDTFWKISEHPDDYLSERSIWLLRAFLSGYSTRMSMENVESALRPLYGEFRLWLNNHFSIQDSSQDIYHIVDSYAAGPRDAFDTLYLLFQQFQKESIRPSLADSGAAYAQKLDLCQLIRALRQRPELYLIYPHFSGAYSYLEGFQRAGRDLCLLASPSDILFDQFKAWVEGVKFPGGRPRPWFKLILFHSFYDCGKSRSSAYFVFFELLDEFAETNGRKDLFSVAVQ